MNVNQVNDRQIQLLVLELRREVQKEMLRSRRDDEQDLYDRMNELQLKLKELYYKAGGHPLNREI